MKTRKFILKLSHKTSFRAKFNSKGVHGCINKRKFNKKRRFFIKFRQNSKVSSELVGDKQNGRFGERSHSFEVSWCEAHVIHVHRSNLVLTAQAQSNQLNIHRVLRSYCRRLHKEMYFEISTTNKTNQCKY